MESVDAVVERHQIAQDIRHAWESPPGSPYAQVSWDAASHCLLVHRVPGNENFDRDVMSRATVNVEIGLADAARTFQEVEAIKRAILAAHDLPVQVSLVGTNGDGSIVVGAEGDLVAGQRLFDSRYGRGTVILEPSGPPVLL